MVRRGPRGLCHTSIGDCVVPLPLCEIGMIGAFALSIYLSR